MKQILIPITLASLFASAAPALAQTVYAGQCRGTYAGIPMQGGLTVEFLPHSQTYGHYGTFYDANGNRYDFEVISNQNGGVGGAWVNGARHRESHIEMRYSGREFVIRELYGDGYGRFVCS